MTRPILMTHPSHTIPARRQARADLEAANHRAHIAHHAGQCEKPVSDEWYSTKRINNSKNRCGNKLMETINTVKRAAPYMDDGDLALFGEMYQSLVVNWNGCHTYSDLLDHNIVIERSYGYQPEKYFAELRIALSHLYSAHSYAKDISWSYVVHIAESHAKVLSLFNDKAYPIPASMLVDPPFTLDSAVDLRFLNVLWTPKPPELNNRKKV